MSLLMDALRKAEADKRAAAARARGETVPPEPVPAGFAIDTNPELRLEPLPEEPRDAPVAEPTLSITGSTTGPRIGLGRHRPVPGDSTLADELSFDRLPASAGSADGGTLTRPELVTAQTVFAAGDRRRPPTTLVALAGVTLTLLVGLVALGYRYYADSSPPSGIPSPRVALGVERPPPAAVTRAEPTPDAARDPVMVLAPAPVAADAAPNGVTAATDSPEVVDTTQRAQPLVPPDLPDPPAVDAPAPPPPAAMAGTAPPAAAEPPAMPAPPAPRDELEMRNGELRIARRSDGQRTVRRQLTLAYAAFEQGDLDTARLAWQTVLREDPAQRDALLGLGALALAADRLDEAHRHYAAVLAGAPDHPVASAALFLIEGGRGARISESRLKALLAAGRDAPYLSFALGNLYARDARWGDAQQAYFAAFSGQPRNADYAYNLAVSLDHLGQRVAARDYYAKAQALRSPTSRFDSQAAAARIATLAAPNADAAP